MTIEQLVKKYPHLRFLETPVFRSLPKEKQDFLIGCIEDAHFWLEQEESPQASEGFKFMIASYALQKAHEEADQKGLEGRDREKFLKPHYTLLSRYNPS